ncbi:TPA: beta-channel forming cytolysin [Clostridium perfringens]|uniref:Delta-like protein A n=1 Tax=Clostridium perfringens TaxID=1502 RepID=A0A411AMB0_CLOPF|nr:delta-like protein A [Clostridium perfringens]QDB01309.1 delta-like protein A [Clostridium perfringens]HAT4341054.1 beta-channel forming cytolysin [Clostridium perfringens]HAT4347323.1 beta-channel forming cytolysin [Clostridium perfringens]
MKKLFILTVLTTIILSSSISSNNVYASDLGSKSEIKYEQDGNVTIITKNEKQIRKYSSTDSSTTKNNNKITIDANFIDDKFSSEMTTILSLKGFIPSGREIFPISKYRGVMKWPFKYSIDVKNISLKDNIKIVDSVPKNTISTKEVNDTISYSIGGGIDTSSKGKLSANANYAVSKSISYVQPDYNTIQTKDTNSEVSWNTEFAETRDGYNVNSWNIVYGNQMFMRSRYSGTTTDNFTPDYKLSSLITGGFSPNLGIVLTASNGTKKSQIEVTVKRELNSYHISWDTEWRGINYPAETNEEKIKFELDWENHTIREIN